MKVKYCKDVFGKKNDFSKYHIKELVFNDFLLGDTKEFDKRKLSIINEKFHDPYLKCFGIIENNTLIYSTWINLRTLNLPMIKSKIKLDSNEGLLEDSYCHSAYRGLGLHTIMNKYRMSKLFEANKTQIIVIVIQGNIPAVKVQENCGFQIVGSFYLGKIFGVPITTFNKNKLDNRFNTVY
ncbi:MAG: hypothetical protein VB022_02360 [Rikenellaceae bacterium]|nr:hypothetical protein [Rikenellaceae bacterium]